ncbi:MAG: hypothetical protein WD801_14470 [Gemmatimonadaceae bacterium]
MNEHLRERILRKIEALSDERGYQVLDYVEYLESKYAERTNPQGNAFTRFTEAVEDRMRAGRVSASAIAETMGLLNRAANVLNGAVAAGKSVATDIASAAQAAAPLSAGSAGTPGTTGTSGTSGASTPAVPPRPVASPEASSPAHDTRHPGSGEEHL